MNIKSNWKILIRKVSLLESLGEVGGMGNITVGRKIFNSLFRLKTSTHPGKVKKEKRRSLN